MRTIRSGEKRDVALCKEKVSRPEIIPAISGPEIITCLIIFLGSEAGPEIFVAWNYPPPGLPRRCDWVQTTAFWLDSF